MIPNTNEYLNFYEAENFCKDKNKTLSTISSESEQIELSKMAHELSQQNQEGARLWLGLVRKDTKDEFSWRYHVIDENNTKVDVTCDVTEPIFWERDPDAYTEDTDCVILDVDFDHTGNFLNHNISNWEPVDCLKSLNGELGHAHGFLCTDNVPEKTRFPDGCRHGHNITTTTTTTTTTATSTTTTSNTSASPKTTFAAAVFSIIIFVLLI